MSFANLRFGKDHAQERLPIVTENVTNEYEAALKCDLIFQCLL